MRSRFVPTIVLAVLSAAVLALPSTAGAGATPNLTASLTAGPPGRLGLHWAAIGAPVTGTTTLTVTFPSNMTTAGALFADTCSPFSLCTSASQSVSPDGHTLTFTYVGTVEPEGEGSYLDLTIFYTPAVALTQLPPSAITATVTNSTDPGASSQTSLAVGGPAEGSEGGSKEGSKEGSKGGGSTKGNEGGPKEGSKEGNKGGGSTKGSEGGSKESSEGGSKESSGGGSKEKEGGSSEGKRGGNHGHR